MTNRRLTLVLGLLMAVPLWAGQSRDDFAAGFSAEPDAPGGLFQLTVPEVVYDTALRPDLGDVRVFNRDGMLVPHVVRRASAPMEEGQAPRDLPFFPIRGRPEDTGERSTLQIVTDERGAVVNVLGDGRSTAREGDVGPVTAYLLDASALPEMPGMLELEWQGRIAEGFAATVDVESSDDLARWRAVARGVTLADLQFGDATLVQRVITLPRFEARYLRVGWPASLRPVRLTGARALFPAREQTLVREQTRVDGFPVEDEPGVYEFDSGGVRPVDRIRLEFDERTVVVDVVLQSRATRGEAWRRRYAGTFYRLERDGVSLRNEAARIPVTTDRYWRLELAGRETWRGRPPGLELGWVPDLLTAVAQGDGPFTVAFGSATVGPPDRSGDGLLRLLDDDQTLPLIASASLSEVFPLGGESKLLPPPAPFPWRTWLLWAILIAGVGLLGWMVRQLMRRMA